MWQRTTNERKPRLFNVFPLAMINDFKNCVYVMRCSNMTKYCNQLFGIPNVLRSLCRTSGNSLYEILGLPKTATADDIKRTYRRVSVHILKTPDSHV